MMDPSVVRLLHRHGGDWVRLEPGEHHSPAAHDPERDWMRSGRIFRCPRCEEEVLLVPGHEEATPERR